MECYLKIQKQFIFDIKICIYIKKDNKKEIIFKFYNEKLFDKKDEGFIVRWNYCFYLVILDIKNNKKGESIDKSNVHSIVKKILKENINKKPSLDKNLE